MPPLDDGVGARPPRGILLSDLHLWRPVLMYQGFLAPAHPGSRQGAAGAASSRAASSSLAAGSSPVEADSRRRRGVDSRAPYRAPPPTSSSCGPSAGADSGWKGGMGVPTCQAVTTEQKEEERRGRRAQRSSRGGSWRRGDEERREKPVDSPRMRTRGGLAAFCSGLCGDRWSCYSGSCICKMRLQSGLKIPLETVLAHHLSTLYVVSIFR
jgi:hypothetical protein